MSKKKDTFAFDNDEPTALAYTDFTKPMPILEGEVAERFIRNMEENDRKAAERTKRPITVEEAKKELMYSKIMYEFEMGKLKELEERIKKLEEIINKNS